uniref:Uncharacterized protein n=1 Tax=Astyanax mexicanus TaxID=7994 RepID=A0A3B1IXB6_ASTMX
RHEDLGHRRRCRSVPTLGPLAVHLPPLALPPDTSQAPLPSHPGQPLLPGRPPDPHPGLHGPLLTPLPMVLQHSQLCLNACPQKVLEKDGVGSCSLAVKWDALLKFTFCGH